MATQITNYQCPACTGPLHYDGATGRLVCDYCGSSYTTQEVEQLYQEANRRAQAAQTQAQQKPSQEPDPVQTNWNGEDEHMRAYSCPSCGAELLCEETTAATSCPYCGNHTVVPGKVSGTLKPDYVIPFKLDKQAAVDALKKHYSGKRLLPKAFTAENHIEEVQGLYVPFWLFDGTAKADMTFNATRSFEHRTSREIITETDHFRLRRAGSLDFHRIPADASRKMPDALMDSIEPFDYNEMVPFSMSYLPGYLADKYDVEPAEAGTRAKDRMSASVSEAVSATATGYSTCVTMNKAVEVERLTQKYALLPVWLLHTRWNEKDFYFAMNGQTGKMVGDLPVSRGRYWAWFSGVFAAVTAVGYVLAAIL